MNKLITKLIASVLSLTVAAALVVMSSYAWMTLSAEPEVGGIEIRIGGNMTILLAADTVVNNEDGSVSHYPGTFSQTLDFSEYETYRYLEQLAPLTPVSTADGVHWICPAYYTAEDIQVQQGTAVVGQMKELSQLPVDTQLAYANLMQGQKNQKQDGCYAYLDFWVVSPAEGMQLRVSTGDSQSETGSFLIGRMEPEKTADGYVLSPCNDSVAASARVGFLANFDWAPYADNMKYLGSAGYCDAYTHLQGQYPEPGESIALYANARNRFTIYEPNGDLHTDNSGDYRITEPLGMVDGQIAMVDVSDRLAVQLASSWKAVSGGTDTLLQREFTTATIGMQLDATSERELAEYFYVKRLQGLLSPYINRGLFVDSTQALYAQADETGRVDARDPVLHTADGATDEITITTLQKNVPQRIRMFIWLEGQDADCVNNENLSTFILNLEFAGN